MKTLKERIRQAGEAGFTMVELAVGISIFGMVILLVFNIFTTTSSTADAVRSGSVSAMEGQTVSYEIAGAVRNARTLMVSDDGSRLDVELSDGMCKSWLVDDSTLYTESGTSALDFDADSWRAQLSSVRQAASAPYFSLATNGITYKFMVGPENGEVLVSGDGTVRLAKADPSTSDCFSGSGEPLVMTNTPIINVPTPGGETGGETGGGPAITYTISYGLGEGATVAIANPTTYTKDSSPITLTNPVRSGYNFMGWTGTGLSGPTMTVTIPTGSENNRAYTATWEEIPSYEISYNLAGGASPTPANPTSYNQDTATFTLAQPTRYDYDFKGWTGTGLSGPTMTVTIPKGSTGARSYTATWETTPVQTLPLSSQVIITGNWGNGGNFNVKVDSTGNVSANAWKMLITVPNGATLNPWHMDCTKSGNVYTCFPKGYWNTFYAGTSYTYGFGMSSTAPTVSNIQVSLAPR